MTEFRRITEVEVVQEVNVEDTVLIEQSGAAKRAPKEALIPTTVPVIQSATVGQTVVVKAVDEDGKPTEWEAADVSGGGASPVWTITYASDGTLTTDKTYAELNEIITNRKPIIAVAYDLAKEDQPKCYPATQVFKSSSGNITALTSSLGSFIMSDGYGLTHMA